MHKQEAIIRVSLIRPLYQPASFDPEISESLGLCSIAAIIRSLGHKVQMLDLMFLGMSEKEIIQNVIQFNPDIIGFSVMSFDDVPSFSSLRQQLRLFLKNSPLFIVGGIFVRETTRKNLLDAKKDTLLIQGEGEKAISDLLWKISKEQDSISIINDIHVSSPLISSKIVTDLDSLPFPARDITPNIINAKQSVPIQGSRGCTGHCTYCNRVDRNAWRGRSPEHIVEEMSILIQHYHARSFQFVDDDLIGPAKNGKNRIEQLADLLMKQNWKIGFSVQLRPWSLDEKTIAKLAESGCCYAFVGLEHYEKKFFREFKREFPKQNTLDFIHLLRNYGIKVQVGAIPFYHATTLESLVSFYELLAQNHLFNIRTATNRLLQYSSIAPELNTKHTTVQAVQPKFQPFDDKGMEIVFQTIVAILDPIKPVWLRASTLLPHLLTWYHSSRNNPDIEAKNQLDMLRKVLSDIDHAVYITVLNYLNIFKSKNNTIDIGNVVSQGCCNLKEKAYEMIDRLSDNSIEPHPDVLYEVMADTEEIFANEPICKH